MNTIVDNMYNKWLKEVWWSKPFQCSGIYAIKTNDNHIVYIGKSDNILRRMAEHRYDLHQESDHMHKVLHDLEVKGKKLHFEVLEPVSGKNKTDLFERLGYAERFHIRRNLPPLNAQIPKEENWREWDINEDALTITADEVIRDFEIYDEYGKIAQRKSA